MGLVRCVKLHIVEVCCLNPAWLPFTTFIYTLFMYLNDFRMITSTYPLLRIKQAIAAYFCLCLSVAGCVKSGGLWFGEWLIQMKCPGKGTRVFKCVIICSLPVDPLARQKQVNAKRIMKSEQFENAPQGISLRSSTRRWHSLTLLFFLQSGSSPWRI